MPRRSRARSARRQSPRRRTEGARGGACALRGYLWRPVRALRGVRESPRSMRWLRAQLSNQQWAAGPVSHRGRARVGRSSGERSRALALERRRASNGVTRRRWWSWRLARSVVMGAAQRMQCVYAARSGAQGRQVVSWSGPGPHISANTRVVWSGLSRGRVHCTAVKPRRHVRSCARWVACASCGPVSIDLYLYWA
jgi:hypothetical protein